VLLSSDTNGRFEILASGGNGISDVEPLLQAEVKGGLDLVEHVYVSRPMLGMQINPLGAAGRFELKELDFVPVPRHNARLGARRRKTDGYSAGTETIDRTRKQPDPSDRFEIPTPSTNSEYPQFNFPDEPSVDWSVIIPTINDAQKVVQCIKTCRQHREHGLSVEFLVVDDGTPDRHVLQELKGAAADLDFHLLLNFQNLGFSASVNHGIRVARGRYVLLCNNDIAFFQPCLEAFAHAFDADSEVGIVGAKLLYPQGTLQHAGMDKVPGQLRWIHSFHEFPADHPSACTSRTVWSVTGALVALRRETLQRLGGLSNAYANAYEDLDYCLHAWTHGIRVSYCPQAVAIHEECSTRGTTRKQKDKRPLFWSERERAGRQYFEQKWQSLREIESFETLWIQAAPLRRQDPSSEFESGQIIRATGTSGSLGTAS
jgi:GT2 family glycosyltransferase